MINYEHVTPNIMTSLTTQRRKRYCVFIQEVKWGPTHYECCSSVQIKFHDTFNVRLYHQNMRLIWEHYSTTYLN